MLIVASIGFNSYSEDKLKKIVLSGADVLRYNFSHRLAKNNADLIDDNIKQIKIAQNIIDELNTSAKIMIDLPINKVRLGDFENRIFSVREQEKLFFKSASYSPDCNEFVPVDIKKLGEKVSVNQTITLGDGEVALQVLEIIDSNTIYANILNNGTIKYLKTFNINSYHTEKEMLEGYKIIFEKISNINPDYIAVSYLGGKYDEILKEMIKTFGFKAKIIMKIENHISTEIIEKLCADNFYQIILLDLGELGVNMPFEEVGLYQREIIKITKEHNKNTWVSTQILESTVNNYIPSRSEISNLTNLILENIDGIVLCHETAVGIRPAYSISVAKKIITTVKKSAN